jgi:ABC-type sulfate transport system substrate-binding protein
LKKETGLNPSEKRIIDANDMPTGTLVQIKDKIAAWEAIQTDYTKDGATYEQTAA